MTYRVREMTETCTKLEKRGIREEFTHTPLRLDELTDRLGCAGEVFGSQVLERWE